MFKTLQCNNTPFHLKFEHFDVISMVLYVIVAMDIIDYSIILNIFIQFCS